MDFSGASMSWFYEVIWDSDRVIYVAFFVLIENWKEKSISGLFTEEVDCFGDSFSSQSFMDVVF